MSSCDAPVIQHESRKLCLSILFGTRKNKVACATNPVPQLPAASQPEGRKKFISVLCKSSDQASYRVQ